MSEQQEPMMEEKVNLQVSAKPETAAPVKTVVLEVDETLDKDQKEAEERREAVYDAVHMWEGKELHPYSEARERLFHRLSAGDLPLPRLVELGNLDAYASQAVKILYLCAHRPEEWRHLRADTFAFIEAIEEWGNVHVPRAKTLEAVVLALKIHNEQHAMIAVAKPSEKRSAPGE